MDEVVPKSRNLAVVALRRIPVSPTFGHGGHEMSECVGVPQLRLVADRLGIAHLRVQARREHGSQWRSRSVSYTF